MQIDAKNIYDDLKMENKRLKNKLDEIMKTDTEKDEKNGLEQYARRDIIKI